MMAFDLRARLDRPAGLDVVDQLVQRLDRQILVGIGDDLQHRGVDAGAQALDLFPRQAAVRRRMERLRMDPLAAALDQLVGAAQHAGRGAAYLDVRLLADRSQQEHGVEGRDFQDADIGHVEELADPADRRLGNPAFLLLNAPQDRDNSGGLLAFRELLNLLLGPGEVLGGEREARGLLGCETTYGH